MMNLKQALIVTGGWCLLSLGLEASAMTFNETTDAGNTMDTALTVPGGTTSILGEIADNQDVDLFKFTLDSDTTFTIEALEIDEALDMNLIVFNSLGQGLAGNDDDDSDCTPVTSLGSNDSCLTLDLTAGDYFFAVGDENIGAFETVADFNTLGFNSDFIDNDSGILSQPTTETLGLVGNEGGPTDFNDPGRYRVNFSQAVDGAEAAAVPEPTATIALLGMSLVGLSLKNRQQKG